MGLISQTNLYKYLVDNHDLSKMASNLQFLLFSKITESQAFISTKAHEQRRYNAAAAAVLDNLSILAHKQDSEFVVPAKRILQAATNLKSRFGQMPQVLVKYIQDIQTDFDMM